MRARDIMSSPVIAVTPDTELARVVDLLLTHRISGVPVIADGKVVGMLGDGDLVHRQEIGTGRAIEARSWWRRLFEIGGAETAQAYVEAHGRRARDVMRVDVLTITPQTPLETIAAHFEDRRVRRLPVVGDDGPIGLVTRADLVRAMAARMPRTKAQAGASQPDDAAIRARLLEELSAQSWWSPDWSRVDVDDGIVSYVGLVGDDAEKLAARVAAENVPGVRGVEDRRVPREHWQPLL